MPHLQILAAAVLWGLIGPVAYLALREGVEAPEVALWRATIAGAAFALHALLRGGAPGLRVARRDWPAVGGFALVGVAGLYTTYFSAVRTGGAALAAVLLYTAPAWVALMTWMLGRVRPSARTLAAVGITFAGVAIVAGAGGEVRVSATALAWGLASGMAYATYYVFGARYFPRYSAPTLFAWALPIGALLLLPLVDSHPKSATAWAALVFLALVPTYGSYLLYAAALRHLPPTRAATLATIEPVVAAVAAWAAFGEQLPAAAYAGAALVMVGVVVMVREK